MNRYVKGFFKFLLLLIVAAFLGWYVGFLSQIRDITSLKKTPDESEKNIVQPVRRFPELLDPKNLEFAWSYQKKNFNLKLTLYQSVYDFYKSSPKEYTYYGELPSNWEEDYYKMFTQINPIDHTIPDLASSLKDLAVRNRLTDDQTVEMITAFVQSIAYDDQRARSIESNSDQEKPNYPYELLFDQKGVCSDKSFLLYALMRELGYGVALFEYKDEKHIALGIQCPHEYSTYQSGYCYTETTQPGHKIGVVPSLEKDSNKAVERKEISRFGTDGGNALNLKQLGEVKIYDRLSGNSYEGIRNTIKTEQRLIVLEGEINDMQNTLKPLKDQVDEKSRKIDEMGKNMDALKKNKDINTYNNLVTAYNAAVNDYKKLAGDYNRQVTLFNQKVDEYNRLVKNY